MDVAVGLLAAVPRSKLAAAAAAVAALTAVALFVWHRFLVIVPSRVTRKSSFSDVKHRANTYPPPYPNGWYHVANSAEIRQGQVVQVEALGRKFAVFRGEDGAIGVLDAFCPHNGANLTGGRVVGDTLQCPFHLMTFARDGTVTDVPWLKEPPCNLKAKTFSFCEYHGMVCVWFDAEQRAPLYAMPEVAAIRDGSMRFCGEWTVDRPIYMHLYEYMENTVDVQHFTPMHGEMAIPWTEVRFPFLKVTFDSQVVLGRDKDASLYGPEGHPEYLYFINSSKLQIGGRDIPKTDATVVVQFIGPASVNRFLFSIPDLGEIIMFQTHLPLNENDGLAQKVRFHWYAQRSVPKAIASYVVGEWVSNWWADVAIWEEKIRRNRPSLVKGDGPIQRGRAWFQQFYSESSAEVFKQQNFDW